MLNLIYSLYRSIRSRMNLGCSQSKEEEKSTVTDSMTDSFYLDIEWEDIVDGISGDSKNSIISLALKRKGYDAITKNSLVVLKGVEYYPKQLSTHWELFNASLKAKPIRIDYERLANN